MEGGPRTCSSSSRTLAGTGSGTSHSRCSRMRLVDLIDQLLNRMAADPRLRFTLDGQTATVDVTLEIRPRRSR